MDIYERFKCQYWSLARTSSRPPKTGKIRNGFILEDFILKSIELYLFPPFIMFQSFGILATSKTNHEYIVACLPLMLSELRSTKRLLGLFLNGLKQATARMTCVQDHRVQVGYAIDLASSLSRPANQDTLAYGGLLLITVILVLSKGIELTHG